MYSFPLRSYNPGEGRWATQDPIHAGLNWYAYVNNDPTDFVDPLGLNPSDLANAGNGTVTVPSDVITTGLHVVAAIAKSAENERGSVVTDVVALGAAGVTAVVSGSGGNKTVEVVNIGVSLLAGAGAAAVLAPFGPAASAFGGLAAAELSNAAAVTVERYIFNLP